MYIPFIGGPASGKSSTIKRLRGRIAPEYADKVFFVPEVFGTFFQNMPDYLQPQILTEDTSALRQWIIASAEAEWFRQLHALHSDALIIADRGFFDIEVYCTPEDSAAILDRLAPNAPMHDYCFYFEGASQSNIDKDRDTLRIEKNIEETVRLSGDTRSVWQRHTGEGRFISVPQCPTIEGKVDLVAARLNEILGKCVFL